LNFTQVKGNGRLGAPKDDTVEQVVDAAHGPMSGEEFHFFHCFPPHEGGEQTCEAEDVVKVTVGDEDFVEAFEPQARF
jgi:hypothetical protein